MSSRGSAQYHWDDMLWNTSTAVVRVAFTASVFQCEILTTSVDLQIELLRPPMLIDWPSPHMTIPSCVGGENPPPTQPQNEANGHGTSCEHSWLGFIRLVQVSSTLQKIQLKPAQA